MKARVIIEVVGSPKDHVDKTLRDIIEKLKKEKKMKVLQENFFEAEKIERFFSAFVEIEIGFGNIKDLVYLCFDYAPSSVEIFDPENLSLPSNVMNDFLNDLMARLHKSDMIVKNIHAENLLLKKELQNMGNLP